MWKLFSRDKNRINFSFYGVGRYMYIKILDVSGRLLLLYWGTIIFMMTIIHICVTRVLIAVGRPHKW